jgi:hypothetical protein
MLAPDLPPERWDKLTRLQHLLDRWGDIFEQGYSRGQLGSGEHLPLLPEVAGHPSVVELGRALGALELELLPEYRAVKAFRCCEWRLTLVLRPYKLPSGKKILREVPEAQRLVPRWVSEQRVVDGENWLTSEFRGDVYLPDVFWRALTEPIRSA